MLDDVEGLTAQELLATSIGVSAELRRRGYIRTGTSVTGELMEHVVGSSYGGVLLPPGNKSWDLISRDGSRVQVKTRTLAQGVMRHFAFKSFDFDLAVVVSLDNRSLKINWGRELTAEEVRRLSVPHKEDGHRLGMRTARAAGKDATEQLRRSYAALR